MPWEQRRRGQFYYSKRRAGRQVLSLYEGAGLQAKSAATDAGQRKARRAAAAQQVKTVRVRERVIDKQLDRMADLTDAFVRAALYLGGYHLHKGEWRKKRGKDAGSGPSGKHDEPGPKPRRKS